MFTNQLSTENLRHWLEANGYDPLQINWIIHYSNRIDVSPLMDKTFSPTKLGLLGSLIANGIDAEHLINLNAKDYDWNNMSHVVARYGEELSIEEQLGKIAVYEHSHLVGTYSKKTWAILYQLIQKRRQLINNDS